MIPFRTIIIVAADFSESSREAFRVACSLARDYGARLIVLHVAPLATVFGAVLGGNPTDLRVYRNALDERLRQILLPGLEAPGRPQSREDVVADDEQRHPNGTNAPEVLVENRPREWDVAAEILRVAEDVRADLIVIGTHGRTGLGRVLMGSVAESVLRSALCPVLTVRFPLTDPALTPAQPASRPVTVP